MKMTRQEKQLAFLEDTASFYNLGNRSYSPRIGCMYAPSSERTPGCAIGRHLSPELQRKLDKMYPDFSVGISAAEAFELLPDGLKDLGRQFLSGVQALHDTDTNWNNEGLSERGEMEVEKIRGLILAGGYRP
jgi:hypothetical protein